MSEKHGADVGRPGYHPNSPSEGKPENDKDDPSPKNIGELFLAEINPIKQFEIANKAAHDNTYFLNHPVDLMLPQVIVESAAIRGFNGAVDILAIPFHQLRDGTAALKDQTSAAKNLIDLPLDIIGLNPGAALDDIKNFGKNEWSSIKNVGKTLADPVEGVVDSVKHLFG